MSNTTSVILVLVILAAVGGFVFWNNKNQDALVAQDVVQQEQQQEVQQEQMPTENPVRETIENPGYSLAEVAAHATVASCWSAINGGVYDLTGWIKNHPGGQQAIVGICGKDGSAAFNGQHGGQAQPMSALASFKIGVLK